MNKSISGNQYMSLANDDGIWSPIPESELEQYQELIDNARRALNEGTKKEKGDSLEALMTYVYGRFQVANVKSNVSANDNQIDHIVEFIDGVLPMFIQNHIGVRLIGESKNQNKSIGSRDVADLNELLRSKDAKMGVFSSALPFSRGLNKSPWVNAEGKRRKLALSSNYSRVILGFTLDELETLKTENFYALLKSKYYILVDELGDDVTDFPNGLSVPYHERLFDSLKLLKEKKIIDEDSFQNGRTELEKIYGDLI